MILENGFYTQTLVEKKIEEMFERLVPACDSCETVAGEIVRALTKIVYRFYNDGDRIGVGYGIKTCNAAARYLMENTNFDVDRVIKEMWSKKYSDEEINELENSVYEFLINHKELETTPNNEDFYDYESENDKWNDWDEDEDDDDEWTESDQYGCEDDEDY